MTRTPPRFALLLGRLMPRECEALVGDLVEAFQEGRSPWWFWRQMLYAIVTRSWRTRTVDCDTAAFIEQSAALAIVAAVAFEIVVTATLLDRVLALSSFMWAQTLASAIRSNLVWVALLAAPFFLARLLALLAGAQRLVIVVGCGTSAALMAFLTLHAIHPMAPRPFLPFPGAQLGAALVFLCGLLAGLHGRPPARLIGSRTLEASAHRGCAKYNGTSDLRLTKLSTKR